jgi:acetyl-CoA acetyltransferase family protein
MAHPVVLVDGCRTPFLRAGTDFQDLMAWQLGQYAIKGLLLKTGVDPGQLDRVIMGCVVHNVKTPNPAREAALQAGVPSSVPCQTVSQACISANLAIATAFDLLALGRAGAIVAGGLDSTSDTPIGYRKAMRKKLFNAQKIKGLGDQLRFLASLRFRDFLPERPAIAEFTTGRTMGQDCESLAARFGIERAEQDALAARSHQRAAQAWADGWLEKEVCRVELPPKFRAIDRDNGVRGDTTPEKLSRLRPAFDKHLGSITAGNASWLTDGAAAVLLMTEEKALSAGLRPKARIVDYAITGADLRDELLLGPAYAVAKLLRQTGIPIEQIGVLEFHEAFAGQVLANLAALADEQFSRRQLGLPGPVHISPERINGWGGSLAIGHPFGATGARLVTTAANRLHAENARYALVAACAAGAHGHAMLLERC